MKYDIITFGSGTLDVFLKTEDFSIEEIKKFITKKGVCFPFGSKVDVKALSFSTGGGGTNVAATFASQGFKTGYCGKIGKDFAGREVLKDLEEFGIKKPFVLETERAATNMSIIFSWGRERTCFVWRGASEMLRRNEIPWKKLEAKWFYLAPLSGRLVEIFEPLVDFAYKNDIKIFVNPGNSQIDLGAKRLGPILSKIDILLLNQEEASFLTKIPYSREKQVFKKLDGLVPGIAIMTKGAKGAMASDGKFIWEAESLPVLLAEKTGAGDAFGSGFLTGFIRKKNIEEALQLGIANSCACIKKVGAKQGLLKKGQAWRRVKVIKRKV